MRAWDALTPRETATLLAIGRRLSNAEIAAAHHISLRTVESHVAALRRKLGAETRGELVAAAHARQARAVPTPGGRLVGRDDDLAAVAGLLAEGRWVTLCGPGGVGKSRLAAEVATRQERVPVVVPLDRVTPGDVAAALAGVLEVTVEGAAGLLPACASALAGQPTLLVLDDADLLLDETAAIARTLLDRAPRVSVLATSRSPLGGRGEVVHAVAPLPPALGLELLAERARTARSPLSDRPEERAAATRVVELLDGLPLALELAAARLPHLPVDALVVQLERGIAALDRARPADRHRTLVTAFAWSWETLEPEEREGLARLAALPGPFTLDDAEAAADVPVAVTLRLVDRSLVQAAGGTLRLLGSLRSFVQGRSEAAVLEDVRRRHATLLAGRAEALAARARTDDSAAAYTTATALAPTASAALRWALGADPSLALRLGAALGVLGEQYRPDAATIGSLALLAADPSALAVASPQQLLDVGTALTFADVDAVGRLADLAAQRAATPDERLVATVLGGWAAAYRSDAPRALTLLDEAVGLADRLGRTWLRAQALQARGIALRRTSPAEAVAAFAAAVAAYAEAGDAMHVSNARYMMAATAVQAGRRDDQVRSWVDLCVAYAEERDNRHELAHALMVRAVLDEAPDPETMEATLADLEGSGDLRCLARFRVILAGDQEGPARLTLLQQAYDAAAGTGEPALVTEVSGALITARWRSGARRAAVVELGALSVLVGEEGARAVAPAEMLRELDRWETALAEGSARARS